MMDLSGTSPPSTAISTAVAATAAAMISAPHEPMPTPRPFSWFALVEGSGGGYENNVLPLGTCDSIQDFFRYFNHVPLPGAVFDGRHVWKIAKTHVGYGICFFETGIHPQWEDPRNKHGVDLVHRASFEASELSEAWTSILFMFITDELPGATGARVAYKTDRRGAPFHKLEVWTRTSNDAAAIIATLREHTGLDFEDIPRRTGGCTRR